ncbi:MAG TPA: M28 family peptidase, partial [Anaerolineae bacterium]
MNKREWSQQSLAHVRHLVETIGPRGSATPAEREAARYVEAELVKLGLPVTVQRFRSPTSAWLPFAYVWAIALIAALLAPWFNPVSGVLAAALCLLALWWLLGELNLKDTPLRLLLPHGESQNVIGRLPPQGVATQRVVLVGHLDSHRTPYFHQTQQRNAILSRLLISAALGLVVNAVIFILVAFTGWVWLYLAAVPFTLLHLVGLIITLQVDRTPYSPGASDNASAVATVLTLAEHLVRQPLRHTELWFLFSGCEEVGC